MSLKHPVQPVPMPISMDMLRRLQQELESLIAAASASGVLSFNSRAGTVTLLSSDVTGALGFTPGVGDVLSTRLINTTAPLTGGGDLSANRTLGISAATSGAAGSMSAADKTKLDAISGTNTGDQTITLTGDATGSGTSSFAVTFATVNSNTGTFGGAASVPQISVNGKGLITGVTAVGIAAPWADITGKPAAVTSLSGTNTGDQFTNMASSRILGRITGGAGAAEELTGTQVTTLLDVFTSGLKGLAPASGGGTTNFLRADGTWAAPGGGGGSGDVVGPAGATDNAVARYDATTGKLLQDSRMFVDDDGRVTNKINSNANEGVITAEHWIKQSADYTLTSTTAEQKMFNTTTNGRLTLPVGTYFFDCQLQLTTMSATSGNVAFDFKGAGTATIDQIMYHVIGYDASNPAAVGTMSGCGAISQQSATNMVTAATGTGVHASIRGTFRVTAAGTIIPSLSLLTAAAAVVKTGTHFRCWRASDDSTHSVGAWD